MKVSVVIPAYNEEKNIASCLEGLVRQDEKADEIIVVDNNSTDTTAKIASRFPVRVLTEERQGIIPSRTKGYNAARHEIIARTDADTVVSKEWIAQMKKDFATYPIVAVSGTVEYDGVFSGLFREINTFLTFKLNKFFMGHENLYGPNFAMLKSAWETVWKELCTDEHEVHEDMDVALHLGKQGKILFDPNLIVRTSARRVYDPIAYITYPARTFKTIRSHH